MATSILTYLDKYPMQPPPTGLLAARQLDMIITIERQVTDTGDVGNVFTNKARTTATRAWELAYDNLTNGEAALAFLTHSPRRQPEGLDTFIRETTGSLSTNTNGWAIVKVTRTLQQLNWSDTEV